MEPEDAEVKAAGCVAWRTPADGPREVVVVHRPRYDDWSLPKGKLDPGEGWAAAALRELDEETGLTGTLGRELSPVAYRDHRGRAKAVRYWLLEVVGASPPFAPNDEVDALEWLALARARERVSYDGDRAVLAEAAAALSPDPGQPG